MTLEMKSADNHRSTEQLPFMLESALSLCKSEMHKLGAHNQVKDLSVSRTLYQRMSPEFLSCYLPFHVSFTSMACTVD